MSRAAGRQGRELAHLCILHADAKVLGGEENLLELHNVRVEELAVVADLSADIGLVDALSSFEKLDGNLLARALRCLLFS